MPLPTPAAPVTLFDVVAQVETKANSRLCRFEPAIYEKLWPTRSQEQMAIVAAIQKGNPPLSWGTALMIYSTSWGACQLMGFNLYGMCGYSGTLDDYMESVVVQRAQFDKFVRAIGLDIFTPSMLAASIDARRHFAIKYNGGEAYADALSQALAHFGFTVQP